MAPEHNVPIAKSLLPILLSITLLFLIVAVLMLYKDEQTKPFVNESQTRAAQQKQRDDGVYDLSKKFNASITDKSQHYGYDLFSARAKQSSQIDSYARYKLWAKQMKSAFPQLGTDKVRILYGNRDQIDVVLVDGKIHFVIEMDETDGRYTINEIRSYAAEDLTDRMYDGRGCFLLHQEDSMSGEDCPHW